jgi:hypothetical protein
MKSRLLILAALLTPLMTLSAQDTRAKIIGVVTDPAGAAIVGASVEATNTATGVRTGARTNEAGLYEIPFLLPGPYTVAAEAAGFKKLLRDGIQLRISDRLSLDLKLEVGAVTESVTVSGGTTLLEVANSSTGAVMDHQRITELPVSGGNALTLERLTPGVTNFAIANHPYELSSAFVASRISVSGIRSQNTEFTLDGTPAMSNDSAILVPQADLVQELKVETNSYDASSGHTAGGYVNIGTKSGTNALHGTAYHFYTGAALKGLDFFQRQRLYDPSSGPVSSAKEKSIKGADVNNRFGFSSSGPVLIPRVYDGRNRTFWIYGYEGFRHPNTDANSGYFATVPTLAERQGDFSALLGLGSIYQLYDPSTIAPAAGGRFSRQPLPGNIIPANRLDATAKSLLAYYPLPNTSGTANGLNNYFNAVHGLSAYNVNTVRVDHTLSDKHRVFARANYNHLWGANNGAFANAATTNTNQASTTGIGLDDVYTFSPTLLLNVRYSFTRYAPSSIPKGGAVDLTTLGFDPSFVRQLDSTVTVFPRITIDGFYTLGNNTPSRKATNNHVIAGDLTHPMGKHTFRFGGDYRTYNENSYVFNNSTPFLNFAPTYTQGPLDNSAAAPIGQGLASFLLGIPSSGSIALNTSYAFHSSFFSGFLQDDWKVSSRLTLNLGIRYEYETAPVERFNRTVRGFDPSTPNPIEAAAQATYAKAPIPEVPVSQFHALGGLTYAGVNGQPSALWKADRNNIAPRIGFAYQATSKTVIRAGFGYFYMPKGVDRLGGAADRVAVNQTGFSQTTNLTATVDNGQHFIATIGNPFPGGILPPSGASAGLRTNLGQAITFYNPNQVNPLIGRWDFGIQRELPHKILIEAMYVGSSGNSLAVNRQIDATPAQYLSTKPGRDTDVINFLSAQVANPFYPLLPGTSLSGTTVSRSQLLRPFPQFTGITYNDPVGSSIYHALQTRVERRFSGGFSIQGTYAWSKFLSTTEFLNATDANPAQVISDQDIPHRLGISALYDLPFGKGRRFGLHGLPGVVLGGWQLQAIYEAQSGPALGFGDVTFTGDLNNIAIANGDKRISRWFNTDAGFDKNPATQRASDIRVMSLRFPGVRGQGMNIWNSSLMKYFRLTEKARLQFRVEAMNGFNHSHFTAPNTTVTSTLFGQLTQVSSVARQVFFMGKIQF